MIKARLSAEGASWGLAGFSSGLRPVALGAKIKRRVRQFFGNQDFQNIRFQIRLTHVGLGSMTGISRWSLRSALRLLAAKQARRCATDRTFGLNSDLTWTALRPSGWSACRDAKPTKASRLSADRAKCSWLRDFHPTVAFTECFPHQRVGTAGGHPWTTCFPCANGSFRFHVKLALLCRGLRFRRLAGRVPGKLAFTNYLVLGVCSKPAPVRMSMWLR